MHPQECQLSLFHVYILQQIVCPSFLTHPPFGAMLVQWRKHVRKEGEKPHEVICYLTNWWSYRWLWCWIVFVDASNIPSIYSHDCTSFRGNRSIICQRLIGLFSSIWLWNQTWNSNHIHAILYTLVSLN